MGKLSDIPALVQAACYAAENKGKATNMACRAGWERVEHEKRDEIARILRADAAYRIERARAEQ